MPPTKKVAKISVAKFPVTESTLKKTAIRVLGQSLVSPEVQYIQRTLGSSATQQQLDDQVMAVRKLAWSKIVLPD